MDCFAVVCCSCVSVQREELSVIDIEELPYLLEDLEGGKEKKEKTKEKKGRAKRKEKNKEKRLKTKEVSGERRKAEGK